MFWKAVYLIRMHHLCKYMHANLGKYNFIKLNLFYHNQMIEVIKGQGKIMLHFNG